MRAVGALALAVLVGTTWLAGFAAAQCPQNLEDCQVVRDPGTSSRLTFRVGGLIVAAGVETGDGATVDSGAALDAGETARAVFTIARDPGAAGDQVEFQVLVRVDDDADGLDWTEATEREFVYNASADPQMDVAFPFTAQCADDGTHEAAFGMRVGNATAGDALPVHVTECETPGTAAVAGFAALAGAAVVLRRRR